MQQGWREIRKRAAEEQGIKHEKCSKSVVGQKEGKNTVIMRSDIQFICLYQKKIGIKITVRIAMIHTDLLKATSFPI